MTVETATGIGASVRRKEDFRFITGKGQYTDDISRPGETRALFVRSPHAHAKIKKVDVAAATAMPGVLAVLTGAELATDKIGNLICGWMIHSKDGSPMKMSAASGDRVGQGLLRRRSGRGGGGGDAGRRRSDAAEKVQVDYEVLPAVTDPAKAQSQPADPRGRAEEHDLSVASRRRQGGGRGDQVRQARHHARHRQQPAGAQRDGAARRDRRIRHRHAELHALEHLAESARRAARHRGFRRHGARAQAARHRARRRRRLRLEDFHLSRGSGLPLGLEADRPSGEMDLRPLRGVPVPTRTAATTSPTPRWRSATTARSPALKVKTIANLGAYMSTFSSSVPTYLYAHAAVGPVRHSGDLLRGRRGLHQHRAGRCLSRRRAARGDLRGRAAGRGRRARAGHRSGATCASTTSSSRSRTRRR